MELSLGLGFPDGQAKIRFHHWPSYVSLLLERFHSIIPIGMSIRFAPSSKKTLDVVIEGLPIIEITGDFESQIPNLRTCLNRLVELKQWIEGWLNEINTTNLAH
jgi:hypothetical protein